jgi:hypothetical protein
LTSKVPAACMGVGSVWGEDAAVAPLAAAAKPTSRRVRDFMGNSGAESCGGIEP